MGTQFLTGSDGRTTQEPYDRSFASDALRQALRVPVLSEQEEQRLSYEAAAQAALGSEPSPSLQQVASLPAAQTLVAQPRSGDCEQIPGAKSLLDRPVLRWIVVGETHGTNEIPRAFGDLVCLASLSQPVAVALEQAVSEQTAINEFIASDGAKAATDLFLSSGIWSQSFKDGRSSEAVFQLFQRLRELRAAGRITKVVAFQPLYNPGPAGFDMGDYESALAASLMSQAAGEERVLVLVGNVHATHASPDWANPPYLPMAGHLPGGASISLDARFNGGSFWACTSESECGAQSASRVGENVERGVTLGGEGGAHSGALNLGVPATASAPKSQ